MEVKANLKEITTRFEAVSLLENDLQNQTGKSVRYSYVVDNTFVYVLSNGQKFYIENGVWIEKKTLFQKLLYKLKVFFDYLSVEPKLHKK